MGRASVLHQPCFSNICSRLSVRAVVAHRGASGFDAPIPLFAVGRHWLDWRRSFSSKRTAWRDSAF
jgi:hypothetical protein